MTKFDDSNNFLFKHTAAIHIVNNISLIERKIINALFKNYTKNKSYLQSSECKIRIKELFSMIGWDNNDYRPLKKALDNLVNTVVSFNIFNADKKNKWGASAMLSHYEVEEGSGVCQYVLSPLVTKMLDNPNIYARLNLMIQSKFGSKYSAILWEFLIEKLKSNNKTVVEGVTIEEIKTLFGVLDMKSYKEFKNFSRLILKPAVIELNQVSDINVDYNLVKDNKIVSKIKFIITKKDLFSDTDATIEGDFIADQSNISMQSIKNELISHGLSDTQCKNILAKYPLDQIIENIKYFESMIEKGMDIKSPPSYLSKAIKDDYRLAKKEEVNNYDLFSVAEDSSIYQFKEISDRLLKDLGPGIFKNWIEPCDYTVSNNTLLIKAPTKFIAHRILTHYTNNIHRAFNNSFNAELKFELNVEEAV